MKINYRLAIRVGQELIANEDFRKFMCGTYSDGTTRSLADSLRGEFQSPRSKEKAMKKKKKKKHKKHI